MRYLCLIYGDEHRLARVVAGDSDDDARTEACAAYMKSLKADGRCVASSPLQPADTAATVRLSNGEAVVTDGPFAETKEQLLGFFLVETASMSEAVEIASRHPATDMSSIEVRPVAELPPHLRELAAP